MHFLRANGSRKQTVFDELRNEKQLGAGGDLEWPLKTRDTIREERAKNRSLE